VFEILTWFWRALYQLLLFKPSRRITVSIQCTRQTHVGDKMESKSM